MKDGGMLLFCWGFALDILICRKENRCKSEIFLKATTSEVSLLFDFEEICMQASFVKVTSRTGGKERYSCSCLKKLDFHISEFLGKKYQLSEDTLRN